MNSRTEITIKTNINEKKIRDFLGIMSCNDIPLITIKDLNNLIGKDTKLVISKVESKHSTGDSEHYIDFLTTK